MTPTDSSPGEAAPPRVEAIDRALTLLTVLADAGPAGSSLSDLASAAGLNKSTVHRALGTLAARTFTIKLPDGNHALGPAALSLGSRFSSRQHLLQALRPAIFELSRTANELVHVGSWEGGDIIYLDKVEPPSRTIRVWSVVGQRVPLASTALGRALIAASPIDYDQLPAFVRNTATTDHPVSAERLREVVEHCRQNGYSYEYEENEPGIACIGVALLHADTAFAAVSITAPANRMTRQRQEELAKMVQSVLPPLLPEGVTLFKP
ncbi:IclR family transcriptional regulator [Tessaracoccus sp. MC1756]|uniref:IclR family transcriptional regulator n=1 Tax=Tessaracoccus sp. MC1756 TaxID=2760311 RepID=UPI001601233F|nr:IclR family transcriptional regulator [Tessaracoccus sp. MC1756]MBB1510983.1 IclR family transcriptional regulator [Tessaracoccus sp. MC1756]